MLAIYRVSVVISVVVLLCGCHAHQQQQSEYILPSTAVEAPKLCESTCIECEDCLAPNTVSTDVPIEFWDVSLQEVMTIALSNSKVLRDLGGQVLRAPESTPTGFEVAISEADPLYGPQGALSAFDAQLQHNTNWQNNDRVFNNETAGLGVNEFQQDLFSSTTALSKTAATGTKFTAQHQAIFNSNNSNANIFPNAWDTQVSGTISHPLLQGGSLAFNRIAGPNAQPGFYFSNGIVIARINTDISIADFEAGLVQFVRDVETAYWDLWFAYRELETVGAARDKVKSAIAMIKAGLDSGNTIGTQQLTAEMQFHALEDRYQTALSGSVSLGRSVGVYRGERQLRSLLGMPATDGRLMRPADAPVEAKLICDWKEVLNEALLRRVEIRKQGWVIKRREVELVAAKNFTLPRLDLYSTYRVRGFGNDLTGPGDDAGRFASASGDFWTFDHQEFEHGVQFSMPLGFRQGYAAVRFAELKLGRERAILAEQKKRVSTELSNTVGEIDRTHRAIEIAYARLMTALAYEDLIQKQSEATSDGPSRVDSRLDAIAQVAEAESQYYFVMSNYAQAIKELHAAKGSLLQLNGVCLSEGAWPSCAYDDAVNLNSRWPVRKVQKTCQLPAPVSAGPASQHVELSGPAYEVSPAEVFPLDVGESVSPPLPMAH